MTATWPQPDNPTSNPAGNPRVLDGDTDLALDERVSLEGVEPADALRALLATPRPDDQD